MTLPLRAPQTCGAGLKQSRPAPTFLVGNVFSHRASPRSVVAATAAAASPLPAVGSKRVPLFNPISDSSSGSGDEACSLGWRANLDAHFARGTSIGNGSFGSVFSAVRLTDGETVAIKQLPLQRGKLTKEATIRKLQKEVATLERMQECRSVVRLEDLFEDSTHAFVVTEHCAGGDLQHFSDVYGPLNERCLALIAFEVALVIKACHDYSVIHGDIKPANFCLKDEHLNPLCCNDATLRRTSWLKAIDFGCSQVHYGAQKLTKRSGTPVFMAPEIFQRSYSYEVDMWSLGVMLYQLFCKRFPFWSDDSYSRALSLDEVARAVTESPIAYNFGPWFQMSAEGMDFIQRCLTRNPSDRLTVAEALSHPWLAKYRVAAAVDAGSALNNIAPFTARRDAPVAA